MLVKRKKTKHMKFTKLICAVTFPLVISGCIQTQLKTINQGLLDITYRIPNLTPQARSIIESYCKSTGSLSFESSHRCQVATSMINTASDALKNVQSPGSDIASLGNAAVVGALQISQGYMSVWQDSIRWYSSSTNNGSFEDDLRIASAIVSAMGADKAIQDMDNLVLNQAKSYGISEVTTYAVAVHSIIDLSISPRGSLLDYGQQLQTARTQWETAKTALSLRDLPSEPSSYK